MSKPPQPTDASSFQGFLALMDQWIRIQGLKGCAFVILLVAALGLLITFKLQSCTSDSFVKHYNAGLTAAKEGRDEEALHSFNKAISIREDADAFANRGALYLWRKTNSDLDKSLADLDRALELNPKHAKALMNRGIVYFDKKQPEKAKADFDACLQVHPEGYANVFSYRGQIFHDYRKEYKNAIAEYDKALAIDPRRATTLFYRGLSKKQLGQAEEALKDYTAAIEIKPDFGRAYLNRGWTRFELGQTNLVLADGEQAVRYLPKYEGSWLLRAWGYTYQDDYAKALEDCNHAILMNPKYENSYCQRACVYMYLGDYTKARADCDHVIGTNPRFVFAYQLRAAIGLHEQRLDAAQKDIDAGLRLEPSNTNLLTVHGSMLFCRGRYADAAQEYQRVCAVEDEPWTRLMLCLARLRIGQDVREDLTRLLASLKDDKAKQAEYGATIRALLGEETVEQLLAAPIVDNAYHSADVRCGRLFVAGEIHLLQGRKAESLKALQECLNLNVWHSDYRFLAASEIARLK